MALKCSIFLVKCQRNLVGPIGVNVGGFRFYFENSLEESGRAVAFDMVSIWCYIFR